MKYFQSLFLIATLAAINTSTAAELGMRSGQIENQQTNNYDLANPNVQLKLAFVNTLLLHTRANHSHQLNGEIGNQYFLRKDDGAEVVFDSRGEIVTNCANRSTPNLANPAFQPLAHFSLDVWPWIQHGNCNNSATTQQQRVDGYLADLRDALIFIGSTGTGFYMPKSPSVTEDRFLAYYLLAVQIERSGVDIYTFMHFDFVVDEHREAFLEKLRGVFLSELVNPTS
ncbi:MAG: hypothetical protein AB8B84_10235 [Granulosicoccus sp.]